MEVEDYEQDLMTDLLHRQKSFNPARASFATFADRVVRHRICTLLGPALRLDQERNAWSLDTTMVQEEGRKRPLMDVLPDPAADTEHSIALRLDISRFIAGLPFGLRQCCDILVNGSISAGARSAGLHRSTLHKRAKWIRAQAAAQGLAVYVADLSDSSELLPVSGPQLQGHETMSAISELPSSRGPITTATLAEWLEHAEPGDALEYYRGFLAVDADVDGSRLPERSREQLQEVAQYALRVAQNGLVHLIQRRHGAMDYAYYAVARSTLENRSGVLRVPVSGDRSIARRCG